MAGMVFHVSQLMLVELVGCRRLVLHPGDRELEPVAFLLLGHASENIDGDAGLVLCQRRADDLLPLTRRSRCQCC